MCRNMEPESAHAFIHARRKEKEKMAVHKYFKFKSITERVGAFITQSAEWTASASTQHATAARSVESTCEVC